jgi:probable F420-dependent oxidoreductase
MRVHAILDPNLATVADDARAAEAVGFDGAWTTETAHDPFLPLAIAAAATTKLTLGTAVAVAFPRSPTHLAMLGDDLQRATNGKFILGLGSQVRAHVERRFSASFDHPAARLRELVLAIHAVWGSWHDGSPLDFAGEFYRLNLMLPFFSPGTNPFGSPPVYIAAVGGRMAEVAGEVADGVFVHGFSTTGYLRDVTVPAVERGLAVAGRRRADLKICRPVFVVTGRDDAELQANAQIVRGRLGFYGSTSAYKAVMDHEGWDGLGAELAALARAGRWADIGGPINDDVLDALAIVAPLDRVAEAISDRFEGLVDRLSFNVPFSSDPQTWTGVLDTIRELSRKDVGQRGEAETG